MRQSGARRRVAALLWLWACARHKPAAPTEPVVEIAPATVSAGVDKGFARPDERVTYTLTLEHNPDIDIRIAPFGDAFGGMHIIEQKQVPLRSVEGRVKKSVQLILQAKRQGSYVLPKVQATYTRDGGEPHAMQTQEVYVQVSAAEDPTPTQLQDIKPLQQVTEPNIRWLVACLAVFALLALVYLLWRYWKTQRRAAARGAAPLPPHLLALQRLQALARAPGDATTLRRSVFAASEVVRSYIEARFSINATDMTTEEFLAKLPDVPGLDAAARRTLKAFCNQTDEVKYAGLAPLQAAYLAMLEGAETFVKSTAPRPPPQQAGETP